ncbi:hypothetical protein PSTG_16005 [Puccinia striiformis f. sp. tritici PST-78]|uniref:DNA 3'-5' helicase n=1 Tax=Puccinia striiformis f. sp. tritici PST-78 TaxID=1165861 RepID=A0A0L0UU51_9BASI|nr:hypothetical protein PSTG_16005 [Puccinia striiformis f. sp. tritici PST-78]
MNTPDLQYVGPTKYLDWINHGCWLDQPCFNCGHTVGGTGNPTDLRPESVEGRPKPESSTLATTPKRMVAPTSSPRLVRHQDIGIFHPSYGDLARHLQCRNNIPILFLSATCRPVAVNAILKSLKLSNNLVDILRRELTRTEIHIICVEMSSLLKSNLDLLALFASRIPHEDLVPMLIYCATIARTLNVLEVIDMARETPGGCRIAKNMLARRYHLTTGDKDNSDCVIDFAEGKFPIIAATMALGLGQN